MNTKKCIGCEENLPESEFYLIKATGKLKARCKKCANIAQKENRLKNIEARRVQEQAYREANRERIRSQYCSNKQASDYYKANKDTILKRYKEYNQKNAEIIKKQKKEYYLNNKEHILKKSSKYYAEHRDEVYARHGKRRAKLKQASPNWITKEEEDKINLLYKIARKVQTLTGVNMHVDHIYPLNGKTVCGLHCLSNLQILTAKENLEKGNSFPDDKYLKEQ